MKEWGFSEDDWFSLPRPERARKVGHILIHAALETMLSYDAREDAKQKQGSKKR